MMQKIIQIGAEAEIILKDNKIIKRRVPKSYRIKELDEKIRKSRTRSEAKLLEKASSLIPIPKILKVDEAKKEISLEFIRDKRLSENLGNFPLKKQKEICRKIGKNIAKLHDVNIIHGDLTTSNMIYVENRLKKKNKSYGKLNSDFSINLSSGREVSKFARQICKIHNEQSCELGNKLASASENFKIFFIDFGLGFISSKTEDKAVDLHLLKEALKAKHFKNWEILFQEVLNGYKTPKNFHKTITQLEKVERRGRYKERY